MRKYKLYDGAKERSFFHCLSICIAPILFGIIVAFSWLSWADYEYNHPRPPRGITIVYGNPETNDEAHNSRVQWCRMKTFADIGFFALLLIIGVPILIGILLTIAFLGSLINEWLS